MHIVLIEPFMTGSHATWAEEFARFSRHEVTILSLPGKFWKWRMHGGAVALARMFQEQNLDPDLVLATDMLDLTTFLALLPGRRFKTALYFHENQLTYPWSPDDPDRRGGDRHYGFINYASALAANKVLFNSGYHRESFLAALPEFLGGFPDFRELETISEIRDKAEVLPLGLDLGRFDAHRTARQTDPPLILWNHRWEYDKDPDLFFGTLFRLAEEGIPFEVAVLGERFARVPPIFREARKRLGDRIVHFGFAPDFSEYATWLWRADILAACAEHDFFGASVVQAIYCNCRPLLPNRLAYPEHIPADLRKHILYDSEEQFCAALKNLLLNRDELKPTASQNWVKKYDWLRLIGQYDDLLQTI